jgi:hypothetical protein
MSDFENKPEGRSKMRRPRLRWLKYVENNLRKLNVKMGACGRVDG